MSAWTSSRRPPTAISTPLCALTVEQDPRRLRVGDHREVGPAHRRMQIGGGGAAAHAIALGVLIEPDAILGGAVEIRVPGVTRLDRGFNEGVHQRIARAPLADLKRPELAMELVLAALVRLRLDEIGEDLVKAPAPGAVRRPAVVIGPGAANIDHGVHRARAAEHFSARQIDALAGEAGLRLGRVVPVELRFEELREGGGNMDFLSAVRAAGLDQRHMNRRVFREARGEHAAGRAGADDDIVGHEVSSRECRALRRLVVVRATVRRGGRRDKGR